MTEQPQLPDGRPLPLDTTAQLLSRITDQLGTQLGHVRLNGTRRLMPPNERPTLVAVAHGSREPRALHTVLELLDRVRELRPDHEGVDFEDDGLRDGEHLRPWMTGRFADELR
ncbi:hypothetical protein AB0M96_36380, partial [Streptomyces sp. NPDC051098]